MTEAISVSKLNTYIKQIFDAEQLLHNIPVVGEVFGVSISRNVIYFSLKDESATLPCVCFYPAFATQIVEGDKLIVVGSPNFYVKGGKLNFNVSRVEKVGQGKLYEDFIKLKQKLEEEGLFRSEHKKPIPTNIRRIGVITSREGAVIQDIKNVAWRRNPTVDIVLYNTKVQGNQAENEIAHAIDVMGRYDSIDVIVVARGGGSLEDLWAYNTEIVARAAFACPKPLISAVGHETDFTIIDFVSDLRAPTPSAAAELLTFDLQEKKRLLSSISTRFYRAEDQLISSKENALRRNTTALLNLAEKNIDQKYYEIGLYENTLQKINPNNILSKGYAKVEFNGTAVSSKKELQPDDEVKLIFKDGRLTATIKGE